MTILIYTIKTILMAYHFLTLITNNLKKSHSCHHLLSWSVQHNSVVNNALLYNVCANIGDFSPSTIPVVTPDNCHLPHILDFNLTLDYLPTPHHNYAQGDYQFLYDTLLNSLLVTCS
jgi:hypothetical protein